MHTRTQPIHIVTNMHYLGGTATHGLSLLRALQARGMQATLWGDINGPLVVQQGGAVIDPFNGKLPRGGTLILIGAFVRLEPWIAYARPERLILICNISEPAQLYAMLGQLQRPGLPPVELAYVSARLRDSLLIPGRVCPTLVDLDHFQPAAARTERPFTIGRLSRDTTNKHHPDDPSLYRLLAWQGVRIRIMGGTCLHGQFAGVPNIELLPEGAEPAADFLRSLDAFFYRTAPDWHEPSGRVIMEALATGLPVVAHTSGGYTDWITPGQNGFLFEQQEEALGYLQALRQDAELHETLALNARRAAETLVSPAQRSGYINWLAGNLSEPG